MTVVRSNIKIFKIQNGRRPPCWKYIRNVITRLPIDRLGRNLGGNIPSCPRHAPHDAVAMATAAAYQRRIEHSAVMGVCMEAECVNQFRWNSVHNSMLGPQWQSHDQILKFLKFNVADGRHVGKYWHTITRLAMDLLGRTLAGRILSRSRHVRQNGVAMATAVAQQRRTGHSAVMGVWRPNAWTNFDEIWYTTANLDKTGSHVIKY